MQEGTAKVRAALELEFVWIVKMEWLVDCIIQWKRMKEEPYLLDPSMKPQQAAILDENAWKTMDDEVDEALNDSEEEEEEDNWLLELEQEIENELEDITDNKESAQLGKRKHSDIGE
jgi:hypothetical protein